MDRQRTDLFTMLLLVAAVMAVALGTHRLVQHATACIDLDPQTEFEQCLTEGARP